MNFGQRGQQMRKEQQQVRHGETVRETAINGKPPKTAPQAASNINSPCTGKGLDDHVLLHRRPC